MHKSASHKNRGFSLVQVSVIIAASSIVLAATLPGGQSASDSQKEAVTLQRMEAIEKATKSFMATNARRPCPASGVHSLLHDSFGTETTPAGSCTSANITNSTTAVGIVPVRALNLPNEYAIDGYGRRFTYIVDKNATSSETCHDNQSHGTKGRLGIYSDSADTLKTDFVMWMLVSHGRDGHGAFPANGSTVGNRINTFTLNTNSQYNANVQPNFTASLSTKFIKAQHSAGFDDRLWYYEATKNTCCTGSRCSQGFGLVTEGTDASFEALYDLAYDTGDIDGDGIDDIVYSNHENVDSEIKIILGSQTGWPVSTTSETGLANAKWIINVDTGEAYSSAVVAIGDATGEGDMDILINCETNTYLIYDVKSLAAAPTINELSSLLGTKAIKLIHGGTGIPGPLAFGDIDGSGINDLLITPYALNNILFLVYGKSVDDWRGQGADLDLAGADPNQALRMFSASAVSWVSSIYGLTVGDINNDGFDDIVAGGALNNRAPSGASAVSLIYGRSKGDLQAAATPHLEVDAQVDTGSTNSGAFFHSGLGGEVYIGQAVHVTDINNDGFDDIITAGSLSVYGIYGKSEDFLSFPNNDLNAGAASFRIDTATNRPAGAAALTLLYNTIEVADLNDDSLPDILLSSSGSYQKASNNNAGMTYVMFNPNKANGWAVNGYENNTPMTLFTTTDSGFTNLQGNKGFVIEGTGNSHCTNARTLDFNKDGVTDIIISAAGYGGAENGALFFLYGRTNSPWQSRYDDVVTSLPIIDLSDLN